MPVYTSYAGEIAQQLDDYRSKGQKEAKRHRPPSDALHMDQNETALQATAEKHLASEQRLFDQAHMDANHGLSETRQRTIEYQTKVDQLLSDDSIQGSIESEMAADRQTLVSASESTMRAEVELRAFRATNSITDEAVYPESTIWHFAVIAFLALIETVINAFFYENAQGLLGGFTVALGVAAINMAGAMILGIGFRYKNIPSIDKQIIGWLCLVLFIVFSLYCNALFATFRSEYQVLTDPTNAQQLRSAFALSAIEAKQIFFLNLQIADFMSFILFGIGILLSGFAFFKGYTLYDKYPGHQPLDQLVKKYRQEEIKAQELLREKVRNFLERRRGDVQSAIHEPAQISARIASRLGDLEKAQGMLRTQAQAIQRDFALVLNSYRQANTAIRATEPPKYFREIPELTKHVNISGTEAVIKDLQEAKKTITEISDKNQSALNEKLRTVQTNSSHILNKVYSDFVKDVSKEAEDRINRMTPTIHRADKTI